MTCWKCGAQAVDNTCTMCGCLQDTRLPAVTPNGKSLRYIYDKLGPAATLTNPTNFIRSLSDIFPDDEELKEQMTQVLQTNVGSRLYIMLSESKEIDEGARRELLHVVRNKCTLRDADIMPQLDLLLEMVGCPTIQQQAAPIIPKTTDKETKKAEKPCAVHQEIRSDDSKKAKEKSDKAVAKAKKKQKQKADVKTNDINTKKEKPFWVLGILFTLGSAYFFYLCIDTFNTISLFLPIYCLLQAIYCFGLRNVKKAGFIVFLLSLVSFLCYVFDNVFFIGKYYDGIYFAISHTLFSLALFIAKYSKRKWLIWISALLLIAYSTSYIINYLLWPIESFSYSVTHVMKSDYWHHLWNDLLYLLLYLFSYLVNVALWWKEGGHKFKRRSLKKHPSKASATGLTSSLNSLHELYKAGVITQEEYNMKRLEVLDRFENTVQ